MNVIYIYGGSHNPSKCNAIILSLGDIYLRNVFNYKQELILWKEHEEKWLVPTK